MARAPACICALAALLFGPGLASADVLSVSGAVMAAVPSNPDLGAGANSSETAYAFVELDGIMLPGPLLGEIPVGSWGGGSIPPADAPFTPGPAEQLTSHLIYIDNPADGPLRFRGAVVFDAEIVAIYVSDERLNATDPPSPFGYSGDFRRGTEVYDSSADADVVERSDDGLTVKLDVQVDAEDRVDTIRMITRARSPNAEVSLDCPVSVRIDGTTVALSGAIHNATGTARTEPSLPVDLVADWVPDVTVLSMGSVSLDGNTLTCMGAEGAATRCPLGRVAAGDHPLDARMELAPGTSTTLRVALIGPDVTSMVCEILLRIPNEGVDAGTPSDTDGGVPPPPGTPRAGFGGGGGARCSASPVDGSLGPLLLVAALALFRWRRR